MLGAGRGSPFPSTNINPMKEAIQQDFFGGTQEIRKAGKSRAEVVGDYEAFTEKFKPKKTTDDCYTPPAVYDALLGYIRGKGWLFEDANIVRPFYPGGDYEAWPYREGDVVVDNPPFSILARIVDFYTARGVRFWLFAPHLTLFNYMSRPVQLVVCSADLTYENGAVVPTDFITDLLPQEVHVRVDGPLARLLETACKKERKPQLPKIKWPRNIVTSAMLGTYIASRGGEFTIMRGEGVRITKTGGQVKRAIFGGGLLHSDPAADRNAKAKAEAIPLELGAENELLLKRLNARQGGKC